MRSLLFLVFLFIGACSNKQSTTVLETRPTPEDQKLSLTDASFLNLQLSKSRGICDLVTPGENLTLKLAERLEIQARRVDRYQLDNDLDKLTEQDRRDHLTFLINTELISSSVLDQARLEEWLQAAPQKLNLNFEKDKNSACFDELKKAFRFESFSEVLRQTLNNDLFLEKRIRELNFETVPKFRFLVAMLLLEIKKKMQSIQLNGDATDSLEFIIKNMQELNTLAVKNGVMIAPAFHAEILSLQQKISSDIHEFNRDLAPRDPVFHRLAFRESLKAIDPLIESVKNR